MTKRVGLMVVIVGILVLGVAWAAYAQAVGTPAYMSAHVSFTPPTSLTNPGNGLGLPDGQYADFKNRSDALWGYWVLDIGFTLSSAPTRLEWYGYGYTNPSGHWWSSNVQISPDGETWTNLGNTGQGTTLAWRGRNYEGEVVPRYVRIATNPGSNALGLNRGIMVDSVRIWYQGGYQYMECEVRPPDDGDWYDLGVEYGAYVSQTATYRVVFPPGDDEDRPTAVFTYTPPVDDGTFFFDVSSDGESFMGFEFYLWCNEPGCSYTIAPLDFTCPTTDCLASENLGDWFSVPGWRSFAFDFDDIIGDYEQIVGLRLRKLDYPSQAVLETVCPLDWWSGYGGYGYNPYTGYIPISGSLGTFEIGAEPISACYTLLPQIVVTDTGNPWIPEVDFEGFELCLNEYSVSASLLDVDLPLVALVVFAALVIVVGVFVKSAG